MPDYLPAGCRMRITASMKNGQRSSSLEHRAAPSAGRTPTRAPTRRPHRGRPDPGKLDTPATRPTACAVVSAHETDGGWEADIAEIRLDTPDDVTMIFRRPIPEGGSNAVEECVLAFQFSPALRAA